MFQKSLLPSCFYHIFNRGNNRGIIFTEDRNYLYFLELFRRYLISTVELYAYCLLPNHFHLLMRLKDYEEFPQGMDPKDNLSISLISFFGTYTKSFNKANSRTGKLFEGRFKRKPIYSSTQFFQTIFYIHYNPQKHGLVADYKNWPYSSYWSYRKCDHGDVLFKKIMEDEDLVNTIVNHTEVKETYQVDFKDA